MANIPIGQRPKETVLQTINNLWDNVPVDQQDAVKQGVHRYNLFENYFKDRSKDQSKEFSSNPIVNQLIANTVGGAIRGAGTVLRGFEKASEIGSKGAVYLADQVDEHFDIDVDRDIVGFVGGFLPEIVTGGLIRNAPRQLRNIGAAGFKKGKSYPKVFLPDDLLEGITPNAKLFTPKLNGVNGNGANGVKNGFGKHYGLYNKISSMPRVAKHLQDDAEKFMRAAYTYARKNPGQKDLKGFGRWIDDQGEVYFAKTNHGEGKPFSLKLQKQSKTIKYAKNRASLSSPWNKDETINLIQGLLEKRNKKHLLKALLKDMREQYAAKLTSIKEAKMSKGHMKSLKNGGLDIAENIEAEPLTNIAGKPGNAARGARQDLTDIELKEAGVILTWDEYLDKHIPLLEASSS